MKMSIYSFKFYLSIYNIYSINKYGQNNEIGVQIIMDDHNAFPYISYDYDIFKFDYKLPG